MVDWSANRFFHPHSLGAAMDQMIFTSPVEIPPGYSLKKRLPAEELERLSALVQTAPFVQRVLDSMPELVGVFTHTRQLVYGNLALRVFLEMEGGALAAGPRPGELLSCQHAGKSPHGCGNTRHCTQCGAFRAIMESITRKQRAVGECRITVERHGKEEHLDLYLWCAPFEVEGANFSIFAAVDISDRNRRRSLERIFFHDLLNTFQRFYALLSLARERYQQQDQELFQQLLLTAEDMLEEVVSQRDLMDAENHELLTTAVKSDALVIINRLKRRWRISPWAADRDVRLDPAAEATPFLCDQVLVSRVLSNMIKNALEACRAGEAVTLGCRREGDRVVFSVHNPGVIPEEVQLILFQRSFSTKGAGRGLGAYSMRLLSKRYLEGEVWFQSDPEKGTTFHASYPLKPAYSRPQADSGDDRKN